MDDPEDDGIPLCPVTQMPCTGRFCEDYGCAKKAGLYSALQLVLMRTQPSRNTFGTSNIFLPAIAMQNSINARHFHIPACAPPPESIASTAFMPCPTWTCPSD